MVDSVQIHLFYPLLFVAIIVLIVTIGIVKIKAKDNNLFNNVFDKSSDNAKELTIDTTGKMKDMHSEVVHCLPQEYEKELHTIHTDIKQTNDRFEALAKDINEKLDKILLRVVELEKERQQQNNI